MKPVVLAAMAIILVPFVCTGQSTLSFPRVMQLSDFATTGFALVNPGTVQAAVTFTLYGADGTSQGTSAQTIPARGQISRLARELFPTPAGSGWVQATSTTGGLQGFWFGGDFNTFADGAEAASPSTELLLPLIGPQSEINVANTGTGEITVLMDLLGIDGFNVSMPFPQRIPPKGFFRGDMRGMFPGLDDLSLPSHMRISCRCSNPSSVAATVIARDFLGTSPSWAVSNGVPASNTATTIYFPQLVEGLQGSSNWRTLLGLSNLSTTAPNNVVLTFTSESGGIVRSNNQTLPANGGLRFTARDLFQLTSGFQSGWVRVTSTSGLPLTGYIAYADLVASGVAVVPPQQTPEPRLLFAHIADLPPWLTGLALLNTNTSDATVQIFAFAPSGSLIGTTSFSLPAGANTAKLLRDLIPQTQTRTTDGGYVFVQSSVPVYGIELFFTRNLQVLANVPAGSGNTFVLPQ